MAEHPLLIFPNPGRVDRAKRRGGPTHLRLPSAQGQARRLAPLFQRLQQAIDSQRLALRDNPLGLQPEQALVLETIGSIANFIKAVRRIGGLEWLGEFELEDIEPGYGFEDEEDPQKQLKGQLFLVMTDERALQQMQSLFERWRRDPEAKFPHGLTPWKHAFAHLHTLRPWDWQDRLHETGLLENWRERVAHEQEIVPFEAELFFRNQESRQRQAERILRRVVSDLGGVVVQQCVIPQIGYHGVLGKVPIDRASEILSQRVVRLFHCQDIMHLRPVGQCEARPPEDVEEAEAREDLADAQLPTGEPRVALFDGLPLSGHRLLDGRLIIDDPDEYESAYQARQRTHGTAMASLISRGDLNQPNEPLGSPVYVRPVMHPYAFDGGFFERIPENVLPVDLVHRAVRRLFEGDGGEPAAAPNVRVINLSIGDRSRPLDRGISSWARLLDWLSWRYNVLFVVSAGNRPHEIELDVPRADLRNLSDEDLQKAVIEAIAADTRHRRLLSPGESANCLTVGSSHMDDAGRIETGRHIDPLARPGIPSTISAHGPGYRRSIKPEIFLPGGRQLLREKMGTAHTHATLEAFDSTRPPGLCVATPGASGELTRTLHTRGTSNAAALGSRGAVLLLDVLDNLRSQHGARVPEEYDPALLKALLVHGADWSDAGRLYESVLCNSRNKRVFKDYVARFLGYGRADFARVMTCTDQRVTVLGFGELQDGEADVFRFPLPPSLSAVTERRRLTITLAWLSPISCTRQNYRIAQLWFDPNNDLAGQRQDADHRAVTRGTLQHEVLDGEKAVPFQDGETIAIKVNCRADADDIPGSVRYGLAVTLEVAEGVNLPIYQEVRSRLRVRIPATGRAT